MNITSPRRYIRLKHRGHLDEDCEEPEVCFTGDDATLDQRSERQLESQGINGRCEEGTSHGFEDLNSRLSIPGTKEQNAAFVRSTAKRVITWKLKLLVLICGVIIVVGVSLIMRFHRTKSRTIVIGNSAFGLARLLLSEKKLNLFDNKEMKRLAISIGGDELNSLDFEASQKCGDFSEDVNGICLRWSTHNVTLQIMPVLSALQEKQTQCFNISWVFSQTHKPEDCFYFDSGSSSESRGQLVWYDTLQYIMWPRNHDTTCQFSCHDYVPTTDREGNNIGGTVVEPIWFSSHGALVTSSLHRPIRACVKVCNDATLSKLCMKTDLQTSNVNPSDFCSDVCNWSYVACVAPNVSQMHNDVMKTIIVPDAEAVADTLTYASDGLERPTRPLSESCSALLDKPLWNIVLNGDTYDNESAILRELIHIADIGGTGFIHNVSTVFSHIGDFDPHHFSNFKIEHFINTMRTMNFSITLPVSPFINFDASSFQEATQRGLLLKSRLNNAPMLTEVHMLGSVVYPGMVDFTNPDAFAWFVKRVKKFLANWNIDYVQLLYGQTSWVPNGCRTTKLLSNPGFYSTFYTNLANYLGTCPLTDVAFASRTQNQIVLLKAASGLKETLKIALASGLAGYPFFIPDLPFRLEDVHGLPLEQLEDGFIRWVQLVSLFPVAHMPWDFLVLNNHGVNITKLTTMVAMCMKLRHGAVIGTALKSAIERAEETGYTPIVSPVWMAPGLPPVSTDDFAIGKVFLIEDQFMIGDDVLVAPILEMGQRQRNVYFPPGRWVKLTDSKQEINSDGRRWVKDLPFGLGDFPVFVRKSLNSKA